MNVRLFSWTRFLPLLLAPIALAQPVPLPFAGGTYSGDGGAALSALLGQPEGLALDASGNLYVADAADHRVRRIRPDNVIDTIAGYGSPGFSGDDGPANQAKLNQPYDVVLAPDQSLYIADLGNARVRRVAPDRTITTFAGGGTQDPDAAGTLLATAIRLSAPRNLALDLAGNLYISDFTAHSIYRVSPSGAIIRIAGTGRSGSGPSGEPANLSPLSFPAGIAVDRNGTLYIADTGNRRVCRVRDGILTVLTIPTLSTPIGLDVDPTGTLFVADPGNRSLRVPATGSPTALATTGRDLVVATNGAMFFSSGRILRRVSPEGMVADFAGLDQFEFFGEGTPASIARLRRPTALTRDSLGNIYFADEANHRVRRVAPTGIITTYAGTGTLGYSGDNGPALQARLNSPSGVAIDSQGVLYISERGNHTIRRVSPAGTITTIAGQVGAPNYSGDNGPALQARLNAPSGLAIDLNGDLLIADTGNNVIRRLTRTGQISTIAGTGEAGFSGDGGPATRARLRLPNAIFPTRDTLYIADTGNNRIRLVTSNGMASLLVTAIPALAQPMGIAQAGNELFVSDAAFGRILRIDSRGVGTDFTPLRTLAPDAVPHALLATDSQLFFSDIGRHVIETLTLKSNEPAPVTQLKTVTVVNALSFSNDALCLGQIVSLFGESIGPDPARSGSITQLGRLATALDDLRVTFNGRAAPIFYASANQLNVQIPYEVGPVSAALVQVLRAGQPIAEGSVSLTSSSPGVANQQGLLIAFDEFGRQIDDFRPARRGSIITIYATGEGQSQPTAETGKPAEAPFPRPLLPVTATIAGTEAPIDWAGASPGFVGLLQVNLRVPQSFVPSGRQPFTLRIGQNASQPGVTIPIE